MYGVKYINIPLDSAIVPTDDEINTLLSAIKNSKKTYIHCHAGKDRTGIMSSCYLVNRYGLSNNKKRLKKFLIKEMLNV